VLNAGSTLTIDAVAFKGGKSPKSTAVETVSGDTACMSDGAVIDASDTANNFKSSDFCAAGEIVAQSVGDGVPNNVKAACGTCMYHRCSVKRNDEVLFLHFYFFFYFFMFTLLYALFFFAEAYGPTLVSMNQNLYDYRVVLQA